MKKILSFSVAVILSWAIVYAQNTNSWQPFAPFDNNYTARSAGLPRSSNIIFNAPLQSSLTPTIGSAGTFARASSVTYNSTSALYATQTSGNPAFGHSYYGTSSAKGYQSQGTRKNYLYRSNTFTAGLACSAGGNWTNIGTFSVDQNVGIAGPDGVVATWQLTGSSSPAGKSCDIGITAANKSIVFSIWVFRTSGTANGTITVSGTGGTPETATQAFTSSSTLQRIYVAKSFSGAATGNVTITFNLDTATNATFFDDAMVEYVNDSGVTGSEVLRPSPYIASNSGSATVSTSSDDLFYPAANITAAQTVGSASVWVNTPWIHSDKVTNNTKILFAADAFTFALTYSQNPAQLYFYYGTGSNLIHNPLDTWTANTWKNYVVTWDNSGAAINSQLYKNGAQIDTDTTTVPTTPTFSNLAIGSRLNFGFKENFIDGLIGRVVFWNVKLNAAEAKQVCLADRAYYGVASCN